jgi:hypothetical protein
VYAVKSTLSASVAISGEQMSSQPIEEIIELQWQQHESCGEQENEKNEDAEIAVSGEMLQQSYPRGESAIFRLLGALLGQGQSIVRKSVTDLLPVVGSERGDAAITQQRRAEHPQSGIIRKTLPSVAHLPPVMVHETTAERGAIEPQFTPTLRINESQKITASLLAPITTNGAAKETQQHDRQVVKGHDVEPRLPVGELPSTFVISPSAGGAMTVAMPNSVRQDFSSLQQTKAQLPTTAAPIFMEATTYRFQRWGQDHSVNIQYHTSAQGAAVTLQPSDNLVQQRLAADWQTGDPQRWHLEQEEQNQSGSPYYPPDDEEQE